MCAECRQHPCHPRCPNAPDPQKIYKCESCGDPICEGEEYLEIDGDYYHDECAKDNAYEILKEMFGVTVGTAEA